MPATSHPSPTWPPTPTCHSPSAAVELAAEQMVVMGQVVPGVGVDELNVGDEVELVLDTLYEDDEHEFMVWKWRPVSVTGATNGQGA